MDNLNINGEVNGVSTVEVFATKASEKRQEVKPIERSKIRADHKRNPRQVTVYDDARNVKLARNIYDYGLQDPIVVSLRADGFYWILRGHRRFAAILTLATKGLPAEKGSAGLPGRPAIAADSEVFSKIQCRVYKGLTLEEEIDLVMDHGDVVLLNDQEKFLAARIMASYGFTHQLIADKLGMSRPNYSNGLGKLMLLPDVVIDTFLLTGKDAEKAPKLTQPTLKVLTEAYGKDQKLPGAKIKVGGPAFEAAWETIVKEGATQPVKALSREKLTGLTVNLSPVTDPDLIDLIQAIRDGNQQDAAAAINRIKLAISLAGDTVGTGFKRIEEGIESTVETFQDLAVTD